MQVSSAFAYHDFGYPSTVELNPGTLVTAYYAQPGFDPRVTLKDPARYSGEGAMGYALVWTAAELMSKSRR